MERENQYSNDTPRDEAFFFERAAKKVTTDERQDLTAMAERILQIIDLMIEENGVEDEDTVALTRVFYENTHITSQLESATEHGIIPSEHPYYENVLFLDLREDRNLTDPEHLRKIDRRTRLFAQRLGFEKTDISRNESQFPLLTHATEPMYAQFSGRPIAIDGENVWLVQAIKIAPQGPVDRSVRSRSRSLTT